MNTRLRRQAVGNIKKIKLLHFVLCGLFFSLCAPLHAQQLKKLPRIGYIAADSRAPTREAFRQGLRDFGYVEGKNILIEWRFAEDKLNRFGEFAAELVRLNVDVIVSGNSTAVRHSPCYKTNPDRHGNLTRDRADAIAVPRAGFFYLLRHRRSRRPASGSLAC